MNEESVRFEREIMKFVSDGIRAILGKVDLKKLSMIEEIRLRADKPIMIQDGGGEWFIDLTGALTKINDNTFLVSQSEITKTLELMSENSIYAYQDEIKNGFITLKGGHRVGISGKVVLENDKIKNIKEISGLNIRVSREVIGCSEDVIKYIINHKNEVLNTLIVSPPQCGKTTMLRDIARTLSSGISGFNFKGVKIGVVDERSEIAACFKGVAQNDVGIRTDVLDGCPKSLGMKMLLRSMSPNVIITDEIGNEGDRDSVMQLINAGVKIITTAHGYNISQLKMRNEVLSLIDGAVFERYVVLSNVNGPGTLEEVLDGLTMNTLYRRH